MQWPGLWGGPGTVEHPRGGWAAWLVGVREDEQRPAWGLDFVPRHMENVVPER